jgi:hypothetical protein
MWSFSRCLDISVFKLDILTVIDNNTTWPHYFWLEFVGLYFNFFRNKFRARNALTCLSCQWKWCWRGTFCCVMVCWVLDWMNIWVMKAALLWQMEVLNFGIYIGMCWVNKNVKRLFWRQPQSCTERGTYLY